MDDKKFHTQQSGRGWVTAVPLEKFSSLHEASILGFMGLNLDFPKSHFFMELNCNLHVPLNLNPRAYLVFDTRDASLPSSYPQASFSITDLTRWRFNLADYSSFDEFINSLNRSQRQTYFKSKKRFESSGCHALMINDWSQHVQRVYELYLNVAKRHENHTLYNLHFFQEAAKIKDYQLFSVWFEEQMIAAFLLLDEAPTLHGFCCGLDYEHSSSSCAYSWINYELIRVLFDQKRYETFDVGITADSSKKSLGFKPIPSRMDVYTKGIFTRGLLKIASSFIKASINSNGKLVFAMYKG